MTKWLTKRNFIVTMSILTALLVIIFIVPVSIPIILALLTAILIDPLVKLAEKKFNWNRKASVTSVFIFVLAIIAFILYYTVTQLFGKIIEFSKVAPDYFNSLSGIWMTYRANCCNILPGCPTKSSKLFRKNLKTDSSRFKHQFSIY